MAEVKEIKTKDKVKSKVSVKDIQSKMQDKIHKEILTYKIPNEANVVGVFWKNSELYNEYKLNFNHFDNNKESNIWKVYYVIGREIVKEGKKKITDIEVGLYLEKHPKLRKVYENSGGYDIIDELSAYIDLDNAEGYINEFNKWWALIELNNRGWLKYDNIKDYIDYTSDDIYKIYNAQFNDIFIHTSSNVKSYNLCSDLDELIEDADKGRLRGLPLHNSPIIDNMIGGIRRGELYMLGASSGIGKSTTMIQWLFPTIIAENEKMVVLLNEQDEKKFRREYLAWIMNNVYGAKFNKERWLQGHFTELEKDYLKKAVKYMKDIEERQNITIIPLQRYSVDLVIKLINKYSAMNVNYFVLDTLKPSTESNNNQQVWLEMQQDAVRLYDCIKPSANNVALWVNLQLTKAVEHERFLGLSSIGVSKNVVDPASTFIAMRKLWNIEREGESNQVDIIEYFDDDMKSKHKFSIESDNHINHNVFFVPKTREGNGNFQVVSENNLDRNTYKEKGITFIEENY